MNISQQFSPPLNYVRPYFISGAIFYALSMLMMYFIDVESFSILDSHVVSFIHVFLIAFVMMYIFASSIQILPVVFEAQHQYIDLFKYIWILISLGVTLMVLGFLYQAILIPFGGSLIFIALSLYLYNFFMTLRRIKKQNFSLITVALSNVFLLLGVLLGIYMSLVHAGVFSTNLLSVIPSHIFLLIGGFISLNIMGVSLVLLPMFGTTRGFTKTPIKISVISMSIAIFTTLISNFLYTQTLLHVASLMVVISFSIYIFQIFLIYKNRARKDFDIYIKALVVSALSLIFFIILFLGYLINDNVVFLSTAIWMMFGGFFGFIIIAHLYKIIPFLVWFHRFSPYVGEKEVPMLHDMYNEKHALLQLYFSIFGLVVSALGIVLENSVVFKSGVTFSLIGSSFLVYIIIKIFRVK